MRTCVTIVKIHWITLRRTSETFEQLYFTTILQNIIYVDKKQWFRNERALINSRQVYFS